MLLSGLLWFAVASLTVEATPASGESFTANLVGFGENQIELNVAGSNRSIPFAELRRLERSQPSDVTQPMMSAGIRGGSRLRIEGLRIEEEEVTLLMRNQEALKLPLNQLDWVRFRPENAAIDPDWLGIVGQQQVDDIIVIRRSPTAIDQAPGIVLGVDDTKVEFELGGSTVPAPIARLEGIVFAGRTPQEPQGTTVRDVMGSRWSVESLGPGDSADTVTMVLAGSVRRQLKLEQIQAIQFSDGSTLLATLEPLSKEYQPLIPFPVDQKILSDWLGGFSDNNRDLILRSRSSVTYRVDTDASTFAALVVPDRDVEAGSGAAVRILLSNEVVWEQTIIPGDDAKGIELDVGSASRITLEVDYGVGTYRGDAGDTIRFIEPRFLK